MQFIFEIIYIKNIYGIYAFNKHRQAFNKNSILGTFGVGYDHLNGGVMTSMGYP